MKINRIFLITLMLFGLNSSLSFSQLSIKLVWIEVQASTSQERTRINTLGYEPSEILSDKVFFAGQESDVKRLESQGFKVRTFELKQEWISPYNVQGEHKYTSYEEVKKTLARWEKEYPEIFSVSNMGLSVEKREIPFVRISSKTPANAELEQTPSTFFTGCHHAREYLSVAVPLRFIEYMLTNYKKDKLVTKLIDSREIFIAPIINPDGYNYDFGKNGDKKMWRKNRRVMSQAIGVDLNRNYSWGWGGPGASDKPNTETYRGPSAFSEPETQAVRDFLRARPRVKTLISFHSFSELVLYPWGHTEDSIGSGQGDADDLPVFEKMAKDMAQWNNYTPQQSSDLYVASGDTVDWAYGELGIYGFTFELSPRTMWDGGFYPDPAVIPVAFEDNLKPMLYILEYSDNPKRVLNENIISFDNTPSSKGIPIASFKDLKF